MKLVQYKYTNHIGTMYVGCIYTFCNNITRRRLIDDVGRKRKKKNTTGSDG